MRARVNSRGLLQGAYRLLLAAVLSCLSPCAQGLAETGTAGPGTAELSALVSEFEMPSEALGGLDDGDDLLLEDGRHVRVKAADEDIMQAVARDPLHLIRTAWHVGNRHLPCEIHADRLVLRYDHVIAEMLEKLGCEVTRLMGAFNPEGGAYGHGRTHGHDHGHSHGNGHDHDGHNHTHGHSHD